MKPDFVPLVLVALVVSARADEIQVYFSPADTPARDCRAAIIREVDSAETSIMVEE